MAEQYIYSRAEKEFTNALNQTVSGGFGFMALSPGMNNALKDAVKNHCQDCPRLSLTDSQGAPLPFLRKVRLPKGRTLLQKSAWIEGESRDFHVAHGYVLEDGEMKESGPGKWFDALFRLGNPNAEKDGIPLESRLELGSGETFRAKSLRETMDIQGLSQKSFCQLLLACFDVLASGRQVLFAWDFNRPGEREFRRSVLYWVYTCLPRGLWSDLGFDSVYTQMSVPGQTHLAFVDKASVQAGGQTPSIQTGSQPHPLGANFLVLDGTIIHNDSKYPTDWYGKNSFYARWLEQVVNTLWECTEENQPSVTQALAEFHQSFQKLLDSRDGRPDPQWYDAACMRSLGSAPQALAGARDRVRDSITERELYDFRLAFMDSFTEAERLEVLADLVQNHKKKGTPADEADMRMLRALFENGPKAPVAGLLGAFMAHETDTCKEVSAVMNRYQEMLPRELYSMLPERIFFSVVHKEDVLFWTECGVDSSDKAAEQRRVTWFKEKIPENTDVWELPESIRQALTELKGILSDRQLAEFWQEPFKARCVAVSTSAKELSKFANNKELPRRLRTLQEELSRLPGGAANVKDELDKLQQMAYGQLLANPAPFMNGRWLREASGGWKTSGEVGETLGILSAITNMDRGDLKSWRSCCKGKSEDVQKRVITETLPKMFLYGTLPKVDRKAVEIFLLLYPENSQQILLQAASQGGSGLLLDLLRHTRKYPVKYPNRLGPGDPTVFSKIAQIIRRDQRIVDKLKEKDGGRTQSYQQLEKFFQEPETKKALSPDTISNTMNPPRGGSGGGRHTANKQRR